MRGTARQDLSFDWRDIRLAGTLHLPASPPPHPGVLMLQGSGPADRESGGYFPPIRDAFLDRGIAAFSFDKPGIGGSSGDWRDYDLADRTDQAVAAIALLRRHPDVDAERVGVWGQSQGGWLVQMLAAHVPDLAFAIANSGAAIGVEAQDLANCEHSMRAARSSEDDIESALAFIRAVHSAARRGDAFDVVELQVLRPMRSRPWHGLGLVPYEDLVDTADWSLACRFVREQYDPAETLELVRCPFLAIFGALDTLVPAWESAMIYDRALRTAGNRDATIVVFPLGNHRILMEGTGEFAGGYLDLLADWAARRVTIR
ncbi:MAG TPA: alpha/beta fold hydrolase [Thermomicrobiaceae bacterium]|nr:alpha/beta fold hydrolase [Thermomicrobiaceae bacterium]